MGHTPSTRRGVRGLGTAVIVGCALAATASPLRAATIGQLAPGTPPAPSATDSPYDYLQPTVSSGTPYVVPAGATTITSWSTNAAAGDGQQVIFKVFRLLAGTQWQVVASDVEDLSSGTVNSFAVNIDVLPGDVIGLDDGNASGSTPNATFFGSAVTGLLIGNGDLAAGLIGDFFPTDGQLNVEANVTGPPIITPPPPPPPRPVTAIRSHPQSRVTSHKKTVTVRFSFTSNETRSTFWCKLDHGRFQRCTSPKTYTVKPGRHQFTVKATNSSGMTGAAKVFRFALVHT